MSLSPTVRNAGLHVGTAVSASVATAMWLSTKSVDLYAIMDQVNVVVADVMKLVASITAIVSGAVAVWRSTDKGMAVDVKERAKDPTSALKGVITKDTVEGHDLAASIPGPVVVAGSVQAEVLAEP